MSTPRVAVVIPSYNHQIYIGKAIQSVLDQTRPIDKLLIIDDGSKDESLEIIRSFQDDRIECVAQENQGAHNTINRAISMAAESADIIGILNSDDFYEPERFATCVPVLEKNPDIDLVCTGLTVVDDKNEPLDAGEARAKWFRAVWSIADTDPDLPEWLGTANFPATTTNFVARADYLKANPFRPYRFNHDYFFLTSTMLRGKMALLPDKLMNYRVHGSNTITTRPAPLIKEMLRMHLDLYHDFATELNTNDAMRQRFYHYTRALWNNVSAFHPGLFQLAVAGLASSATPDQLEALIEDLNEESLEELRVFPNRLIVNEWDEHSPLSVDAGLSEKLDEIQKQRKDAKDEVRALKEINRLRCLIQKSKLARSLAGKAVAANSGKTASEKLTKLQEAIENSSGLKLAANLGSKSAKELLGR